MNTNLPITQPKSGFGSLFRNVFKRNAGIAVLYAVLCFVSYPLILALLAVSRDGPPPWLQDNASSFIALGILLMGGLSVLFSMILSTRLYGHMHSRPAVDVYHAMPVTRGTSFWINYLVGLILVLVPFVGNVMISLVFYQGWFSSFFIMDFFLILLVSLLAIIEFFTFCVFFHVTCGTNFGANLYNLMLNVGYLVAVYVLSAGLTDFLPGYGDLSSLPMTALLLLVPIGRVGSAWTTIDTALGHYGSPDVWIHLAILAVLLLLSFVLYRRRKSEAAGSGFAFSLPKHVLRFIVTFGGAMLFALIFYFIYVDGSMVTANAFPVFFGAFVGGALTHIILEIIFSKGFGSVLKSLPAFAVFCVVFTVAYCLVANGWFGYDTRIPRADEIQRVSVSSFNSYYFDNDEGYVGYEGYVGEPGYPGGETPLTPEEQLMNEAGLDAGMGYTDLRNRSELTFAQAQNIELILSLHRMAIQLATQQKPYKPGDFSWSNLIDTYQEEDMLDFTLTYYLKNGKVMTRTYYLPLTEQCRTTMETLRYSPENLQNFLGFTGPKNLTFGYRVIIEHDGNEDNLVMEERQRTEFLDALKADMESESAALQAPDRGDTIKVAVLVTVTYIDGYSEVWVNRLTINPTQYPKAYAFLLTGQAKDRAA